LAASLPLFLLLGFVALTCGCNRLRRMQHDTVYVSVRQTYLHDRVAAVSNRVGTVVNGQPLEVLEHGRRFLKVKTQKNEIGWIEERAVVDSKSYDAFEQLGKQHKQDPVIATAVLRDDLYLHIFPGRDTEHFYLLAANAKVQLLVRASVPKVASAGFGMQPKTSAPKPPVTANAPAPAAAKTPAASQPTAKPGSVAPAGAIPVQPEPPPVIMEDWWLARDDQGHAGWLLASRVDVDVPDEIGVYGEGQRIVGAYVLAKVTDPEANTPNHEVPEYVTVLAPPKSGLPFDFDQVRVFTWSLKRHRYETAFRLHPIQGFLPVRVSYQPVAGGSAPVFSFQIANGDNRTTDAATGITRPVSPRTINYMMVDTQVKRIGPDMGPIPITRSPDDQAKADKSAKQGKGKKKGK
jgi:hypothetical protein